MELEARRLCDCTQLAPAMSPLADAMTRHATEATATPVALAAAIRAEHGDSVTKLHLVDFSTDLDNSTSPLVAEDRALGEHGRARQKRNPGSALICMLIG